MASLNRVIIIGNAGKDAEISYLPSGTAIAKVSVATSNRWKDKESGELKEDTQWHRLVFFDRKAELAGEYIKKGSPICVEGHLKYGKYTDSAGVERYTTDIVVDNLQLLGSRQEGGGDDGSRGYQQRSQGGRPQEPQGGQRNEYAEQRGRPAQRPAQGQAQGQAPRAANNHGSTRGEPSRSTVFDDMEDDIPFLFNMNTVSDTVGLSKSRHRIRHGKALHLLHVNKAAC